MEAKLLAASAVPKLTVVELDRDLPPRGPDELALERPDAAERCAVRRQHMIDRREER